MPQPKAAIRSTLQATVAHEITHIVLEHRTRNSFGGLPAWLHEGLATTVESTISERFPYDDIMTRTWRRMNSFPLRGITGSFPAAGRAALNAYAQSNSLVGYIIETWGQEGVARLLEAYAGGVSDNEAVLEALGVSLDELDRAWLGTYGVESPTFTSLTQPNVAAAVVPPDSDGAAPATQSAGPVAAAAAALAIVAAARGHAGASGDDAWHADMLGTNVSRDATIQHLRDLTRLWRGRRP